TIATASTTSTAAPTTTAPTASTVTPPADPNIPSAARAHTPAGAAAFVKYFHEQLNLAWGQPRAGLLAPLSVPGCKTCRALEDNAKDMVATRRHILGEAVRIDSTDAGATESNGDQTVVITGEQLKTAVVDSNGRTVRNVTTSRIRSLATTRWATGGWRISEIKVLG
ncbi:MAG TPA: DUF6318 family protein, partial [Dermatophilaceae bacterium]